MKKKAKAKGKAKVTRKRSRPKDLGAKKAGTVKGGIAWGVPTEVAAKVNQNLKEFASLKYYK
jgi:hypothetical protein